MSDDGPDGGGRSNRYPQPGYGLPPGYGPPPPGYDPPPPGYGAIPSWLPKPTAGNARTGPLPLHPMSVGDILDGAFKLLRANARSIVLVVATLIVPVELLVGFLQRSTLGGKGLLTAIRDPASAGNQADPATTYGVIAVTFIVYWFVVPLICGGISRIVMVSYLGGELPAKEAIRASLRRAPALLVATVVVHLVELVAILACVVPVLFVIPLIVMVAPAIAIEELGPFAGIRRSFRLGSRRYWPTLGVALLAGVIGYFMGSVLGTGPNIVALMVGLKYGWILLSASNILVAFVTIPLITIVATLLYLDARIRTEGFDLQLVAVRLDQHR